MAQLLIDWNDALRQISEGESLVEYEWIVSAYNGNTNAKLIWKTGVEEWIAKLLGSGMLEEVEPKRYRTKYTNPPAADVCGYCWERMEHNDDWLWVQIGPEPGEKGLRKVHKRCKPKFRIERDRTQRRIVAPDGETGSFAEYTEPALLRWKDRLFVSLSKFYVLSAAPDVVYEMIAFPTDEVVKEL